MIARRVALCRIGLALLCGPWSIISCSRRSGVGLMRPPSGGPDTIPFASAAEALNVQLLKELGRLESRDYSEEGIPVFLACENLVPSEPAGRPHLAAALNRRLFKAFCRNVEALAVLRPNLKAMDVAKIVELLADRDFTSGGRELRP